MTSQQGTFTALLSGSGRRPRGRHAAVRQALLPAPPARQDAVAAGEHADFVPLDETGRARGRGPRLLLHPLTAICALQAALSLTLVWSNTAFTDEADYLWVGRLVLANWLHGQSWPTSYGHEILPGSPLIYPPIAGLAASAGGLAGARILSLAFMLAATVLLYFTAARLTGPVAAAFAATAWVLTEPVIRLAFATADPLSILLTALSAWLIVQAGDRRHHGELVTAAAVALALANVTSYAGAVIDPAVVAFAFFVWLLRFPPQRAASSAAWFTGGWLIFLCVALTLSRSWPGFAAAVSGSGSTSHQDLVLVLIDIWTYAGLVIVLALAAVVVAGSRQDARRTALVAVLGCSALIVPAVQLASQTASLLDRRLAYGIWFAAIAVGYGCVKLLRWLPAAGRPLTAAVCAVAIGYLGFTSWQSASGVYHGWPNSRSFIAAFRPAAASTRGLLFVASQEHVAQYYTSQGNNWTRWNADGLSLDPSADPTPAYYRKILRQADYGLVVLFYSTSFTSANIPANVLTSTQAGKITQQVLGSAGNSAEPGLAAFTEALSQDRDYRVYRYGPFDNANDHGVYVIWRKTVRK